VEIESTFTRQHFLKYCLASMLKSISFYFMAVITIGFTIVGFSFKTHWMGWVFAATIVVAIVYYCVWFIKEAYYSESSKEYFLKRTIVIDDDGIVIRTVEKTYTYLWKVYSGWWKTNGCYIVGGNHVKNALFIPQSDVAANQVDELEKLLNEKIYTLAIKKNQENIKHQ
jgi:hypothetical protein